MENQLNVYLSRQLTYLEECFSHFQDCHILQSLQCNQPCTQTAINRIKQKQKQKHNQNIKQKKYITLKKAYNEKIPSNWE